MKLLAAHESEEEAEEDVEAELAEKLRRHEALQERVRHAWNVVRNFVFRSRKKQTTKQTKRSQYRWTAVHTRLTSIARSTDSRLQLYERYLETPHVWIDGFRVLPRRFIEKYKFHFDQNELPTELERYSPMLKQADKTKTQPQQRTAATFSSRGRLQEQSHPRNTSSKNTSHLKTRAKTANV